MLNSVEHEKSFITLGPELVFPRRAPERLVLHFFGYKREFLFSFQNYPKNPDLSNKMDIALWVI